MIHQFDPRRASDDQFDPGMLSHLVPGNRGRLLDPRRTPMVIVALELPTGHFIVRIEAFEDRGAEWHMPLEAVGRIQFEKSSRRADAATVAECHAAVKRFDRPLRIECDPAAREQTLMRLAALRAGAAAWLGKQSWFRTAVPRLDFASRTGPPEMASAFAAYLGERGLAEMEEGFAARYVSNPGSGEMVKGHRMVCAELGLAPFAGTVVRDANLFAAPWSKAERARHIEHRMAFVQALFSACGHERVTLFRGIASEGPPTPPREETFVSATFDEAVARSMMGATDPSRTGVLLRQQVPIERLFMTYIETAQMNRQFLESEAVLFRESGHSAF